MASPDLSEPPWSELPVRTATALIRAGFDTPEAVAELSGTELRSVKGVGPVGYRAVRAIWPDPSGGGSRPGADGGTLQTGNPGNRGGHGRPSSRVRAAATLEFERRIPRLAEIADGSFRREGRKSEPVEVHEALRAIDLLGKYGPGTRREVDHVLDFEATRQLIRRLAEPVADYVPDEEVRKMILARWKVTVREFFEDIV